jgi:hypothetical protein
VNDLVSSLTSLCSELRAAVSDSSVRDRVDEASARLRDPLRVAIAGRVKAGKSTLLNAIVGESLAATDASECTRVVTWYRDALTYDVTVRFEDGTTRSVPFDRAQGRLDVDLEAFDAAAIDRIDVSWPSARLATMTLVDTPGLEGRFAPGGERSLRLLGYEGDGSAEVDAVIYLMSHVHRSDVEFLDAFRDRSLGDTTPVNAVAVLSRVDEIGAGRRDAMESATIIAAHYAADERVRAVCSTVVPVAGLIAATAASLTGDEMSALRRLALLDPGERELMLLSADRFCDPEVSPLPSATRLDLLLRLGMFGVRLSLDHLAVDGSVGVAELASMLREASGIAGLLDVLDGHFARRARLLKARSAMLALRAVSRDLASSEPELAAHFEERLEVLEAGSTEMAALRLWHLVLSGGVVISDSERDEISSLTSEGDVEQRLGCHGTPEELRKVVAERVALWRERAANPFSDPPTAELCEIVARQYESAYAELESAPMVPPSSGGG